MIPCQYSVIKAILEKFDILNLSTYQLQKITAPSHSGVVPKFIMMWTVDSALMNTNLEIDQI